MSDVRSQFDECDQDGNGRIDLIEFRQLLERLGSKMEPAKVEKLFDVIDSDESGLIGFDEFAAWWSERSPS